MRGKCQSSVFGMLPRQALVPIDGNRRRRIQYANDNAAGLEQGHRSRHDVVRQELLRQHRHLSQQIGGVFLIACAGVYQDGHGSERTVVTRAGLDWRRCTIPCESSTTICTAPQKTRSREPHRGDFCFRHPETGETRAARPGAKPARISPRIAD